MQGVTGGVAMPVMVQPSTTGGWSAAVVANITTPGSGSVAINGGSFTASDTTVKASAGTIASVQCDNIAGSLGAYAQILNVASGGTLGTAELYEVALPAGQTGGIAFPSPGIAATTGITIAASTTANGSTAAGTAVNCTVVFK